MRFQLAKLILCSSGIAVNSHSFRYILRIREAHAILPGNVEFLFCDFDIVIPSLNGVLGATCTNTAICRTNRPLGGDRIITIYQILSGFSRQISILSFGKIGFIPLLSRIDFLLLCLSFSSIGSTYSMIVGTFSSNEGLKCFSNILNSGENSYYSVKSIALINGIFYGSLISGICHIAFSEDFTGFIVIDEDVLLELLPGFFLSGLGSLFLAKFSHISSLGCSNLVCAGFDVFLVKGNFFLILSYLLFPSNDFLFFVAFNFIIESLFELEYGRSNV